MQCTMYLQSVVACLDRAPSYDKIRISYGLHFVHSILVTEEVEECVHVVQKGHNLGYKLWLEMCPANIFGPTWRGLSLEQMTVKVTISEKSIVTRS